MTLPNSYLRRARGRSPKRQGASRTGQLANWTTSIVTQIMGEMEKRRVNDRAVDLYTNDAMSHGILETIIAEGVGIGLTPQFAPDLEALGLDGDWRATWKREAFRLFKKWALDPRLFADAQARLTLYGLQNLAAFHWKLNGIGVFQMVHRPRPGAPLPLAILPIDPFRLGTPAKANADIYDGVEVDDCGMPVAVHILRPGATPGSNAYDRYEVWDSKSGLPKILLVNDVRHIAEYRQDSILGPMIPEIRSNRDFVEAALVRSLMANMMLAAIRSSAHGGKPTSDNWEDRFQEYEQAMVLRLLPNEDVTMLNNDAPGANFGTMFETSIKRMGMSTSRGFENILRKYEASYSASRMNELKSGIITSAEQQLVLNPKFNDPILAWMLYSGVANGHLRAKSINHFRDNLRAYTEATWLPQPVREIDPLKASNAHKNDRSIGERLLGDACAEQGQDLTDYVRRAAEEIRIIHAAETEYGVSLSHLLPPEQTDMVEPEKPETKEKGDADSEA